MFVMFLYSLSDIFTCRLTQFFFNFSKNFVSKCEVKKKQEKNKNQKNHDTLPNVKHGFPCKFENKYQFYEKNLDNDHKREPVFHIN